MSYMYGGDYFGDPVLKTCSKCGTRNIKQWDVCDECGHYDNPYHEQE